MPNSALAVRTELGVELLRRGLRFTLPSAFGNVLQLPRTTPMLVEASWVDPHRTNTAMLEAAPGKSYTLWDDRVSVTLRTLAGDEYLLEPLRDIRALSAGPKTSRSKVVREERALTVGTADGVRRV